MTIGVTLLPTGAAVEIATQGYSLRRGPVSTAGLTEEDRWA